MRWFHWIGWILLGLIVALIVMNPISLAFMGFALIDLLGGKFG